MPIFDRKPWKVFQQFEEHVRDLVGKILPTGQPVTLVGADGDDFTAYLSFAPSQGAGRTMVELDTMYGSVQFYFRQELHAVREKVSGFRLTTRRYWYGLAKANATDAFMRWEYVDRNIETDALHPRHHLHIHDVTLAVDDGESRLDLKKTHLPTGRVTIEEILRFLVSEFGVVPACGARWDDVLKDAERRFYEEFASKSYK